MGIQIINGGFLTTIQDMGRYGYQETGMSVSGVMDTRAASLANTLLEMIRTRQSSRSR